MVADTLASNPNNVNDNDNDKASKLAPLTAMPSKELPNLKFGGDVPGEANNKTTTTSLTQRCERQRQNE